jgi:hypothetical protein
MNPGPNEPNRAEIVDEESIWGVGLGIVAVALFPLSLPLVVLTLAALALLALPLLVVALLAVPLVLGLHLAARLRRRTARESWTPSREHATESEPLNAERRPHEAAIEAEAR